jgi:hypothetical protein
MTAPPPSEEEDTGIESPRTKLDMAVDELKGYFTSPAMLTPVKISMENQEDIKSELRRIIFGSPAGGMRAANMVAWLAEKSKDIVGATDTENVKFPIIIFGAADSNFNVPEKYADSEPKIGTLEDVVVLELPEGSEADAAQGHLSVVLVMSHILGPALRDSHALELFFNSIPTIQLSLCQPYMTVNVSSDRSGNPTGHATGMSLFKFLEGAVKLEEKSINALLAGSGVEGMGKTPSSMFATTKGSAGMEVFTSPQTLVPTRGDTGGPEPHDPRLRVAPIIDRFRPFMSIKGLTISTAGAGFGTISYRTASLQIVLHDRSRLGEIAELLNPGQYKSAEFDIEWGWSHPHSSPAGDGIDNAYGRFLNNLRKRELYRVTNYKMSFDDVGQANITLALHSTAGVAMDNTTISMGPTASGFASYQVKLEKLTKEIAAGLELLGSKEGSKGNRKSVADVRGNSFVGLMTSVTRVPNMNTPIGKDKKALKTKLDDLTKKLKAITKDKKATGEAKKAAGDILDAMVKLFEDKPEEGATIVELLYNSMEEAVERKMSLIDNAAKDAAQKYTGDPFLFIGADWKTAVASGFSGEIEKHELTKKPTEVSLAKLFAVFVGSSLTSSDGISDVQLIFHKFNNQAGKCGALTDGTDPKNIGEFKINVAMFKTAFTAYVQRRRTVEITVKEFISFLVTNFVDDMSSENYGLTNLYTGTVDAATGQYKVKRTEVKNAEGKADSGAFADAVKSELLHAGAAPEFRMPQVMVSMEHLPAWGDKDTNGIKGNNVLKVHILDKAATPHNKYVNTLASASEYFTASFVDQAESPGDKALGEVAKEEAPPAGGDAGGSPGTEDAAEGGGLAGVEVNSAAMMAAIKSGVPTITYGTAGSVIKQASLSTENNPALSTIMMLNGGPDKGPMTPAGMGPGNLPMMIYPTQLTMTTIGCPLMEYMQQFFINFGTGTSVDNIYHAVGVIHKFGQGVFETSLKFKFVDAYGTFRTMHGKIVEALKPAADKDEEGAESDPG